MTDLLAHKFGVPITFLDYDELEEEEKDAVKKLPTIHIRQDTVVVNTITTAHADMLEMWLRTNVRVNATEDF